MYKITGKRAEGCSKKIELNAHLYDDNIIIIIIINQVNCT
jgi:hypothetical protein